MHSYFERIGKNLHNKTTLTYFKTSLAASYTKDMSHFSHPCMHMDVHAYANEMLMRLDRFLDKNLSLIIFIKLCSCFLMSFKEIFVMLKL